jgi:hypothetical protein
MFFWRGSKILTEPNMAGNRMRVFRAIYHVWQSQKSAHELNLPVAQKFSNYGLNIIYLRSTRRLAISRNTEKSTLSSVLEII